jgi:hypothetical protein
MTLSSLVCVLHSPPILSLCSLLHHPSTSSIWDPKIFYAFSHKFNIMQKIDVLYKSQYGARLSFQTQFLYIIYGAYLTK